MNELSERFLGVYNYLKSANKVTSKVDFANKLGISSSIITDITKGRTNPGIHAIRNIVILYPDISMDWLIAGVGEMLKSSQKSDYTPTFKPIEDAFLMEENESTLYQKTAKLSPKTHEKLSPTLSPTHEYCKLCEEKELRISLYEENNQLLREMNELLRDRIQEYSHPAKKEVG